MGRVTPEEAGRNWAIWRKYRKGGLRYKDLAVDYGLSIGRIQQIIERCEKKTRYALTRPFMQPQVLPEDSVINGLLGVEFIFRADNPRDRCGELGDWAELQDTWFRCEIGG